MKKERVGHLPIEDVEEMVEKRNGRVERQRDGVFLIWDEEEEKEKKHDMFRTEDTVKR